MCVHVFCRVLLYALLALLPLPPPLPLPLPYISTQMQFTFASNAATLIGGCLVNFEYKLRLPAAFISAFVISVSVCV